MQPTLDVIIPCYNAANTLRAASESALAQSVVQTVWLVDDASDDGTPDIMQELAAQYPQIRCEYLPSNGGAACARNWGAPGRLYRLSRCRRCIRGFSPSPRLYGVKPIYLPEPGSVETAPGRLPKPLSHPSRLQSGMAAAGNDRRRQHGFPPEYPACLRRFPTRRNIPNFRRRRCRFGHCLNPQQRGRHVIRRTRCRRSPHLLPEHSCRTPAEARIIRYLRSKNHNKTFPTGRSRYRTYLPKIGRTQTADCIGTKRHHATAHFLCGLKPFQCNTAQRMQQCFIKTII